MGFSDHSPFIREDGIDTLYRVPVSKGAEYVQSIRALREKYKDQIDIIIGFEMEYLASYTMLNEETENYDDYAKVLTISIAEVQDRRITKIKVVLRDATQEEIEQEIKDSED